MREREREKCVERTLCSNVEGGGKGKHTENERVFTSLGRSHRTNIYGWFATSLTDCKKSVDIYGLRTNRSHIISGTKC